MSIPCKDENRAVYLEPVEHKYFHKDTGKCYTSVTQVISTIEHEFDGENIAEAIENQDDEKKHEDYVGMSKHDILDYWQRINDEANEYGTRVHEIIEDYLNAKKWYIPQDDLEKKVIEAYDELLKNERIDEGQYMYPEKLLYSDEYELAGTTDLLVDVDEEFFDIGDWKTNKRFEFFSRHAPHTLKPPFDYLQDCHYSVYTLQLSTYALMYEQETGKKCRRIWIGYWDRNKEVLDYIPVFYVKNEAQKLMEHHKYNNLIFSNND